MKQRWGFSVGRQLQAVSPKAVSLNTIFLVFLKVGAFTFGGGYAMLPIIRREVVERRSWVGEEHFLDLLIVAQSLPGAIALNSAIQVGMRLRGLPGGAIAALGVITPSVAVIMSLAAYFMPLFRDSAYVQAIFYGLRPAVVGLIAAAVINLGRSIFHHWSSIILSLVLLAAVLFLKIHPVIILLAGGLAGLILFGKKDH